jgi:DNA gyrase subunit A
MITPEEMVVTLSHAGYAKAQPLSQYQAQKRGGRGRSATATKDEDFIDKLFVANALDTVLCFSSLGKVYWIKVYELPQAGEGRPGAGPWSISCPWARASASTPSCRCGSMMRAISSSWPPLTGTVKKTPLLEFSRPLSRGIIALDLHEDERLVDVAITDGEQEILLFSSAGKAVRFRENEVRSMGRGAHGVRGIMLDEGQRVIAMLVVDPACTVLGVTENGYGKRTPVEDFPTKGRGTKGVIAIGTSARNGAQVGAVLVLPEDEIMLITVGGTLVRTTVAQIPTVGRTAQGVKLIRVGEGERLAGVERILALEGERGGRRRR